MILRISITIVALLALSLGVRMFELAADNLSEDESITLFIINGYKVEGHEDFKVISELPETFTRSDIRKQKTYGNVVEASIRHNGNSMGYYLLLSWWTKVFGNTNYSIRFLSLVFGVLTVILGYYFARQLFNERTAVIAGVLLSLHPLSIEFSQLARAYVPATFFVLLSTYSLYQVAVSKRHLWLHIPLYVIAVFITALCHYLVIYVLVAHVLLVLFFHSHRKAMIQYSIMAVIMLGLFSIWWWNGGLEGKGWNDKELNEMVEASGVSAKHFFYSLGLTGAMVFGERLYPFIAASWIPFVYLLVPGVILYFAFERIRKSEYFRQAMFVLFPILLYLVFLAVSLALLPFNQVFDKHYTAFALPFACILLAFGFDRMIMHGGALKVLAFPGLVVMIAVMTLSAFPQFLDGKTQAAKFPYHQAASQVEKLEPIESAVVFGSKKNALLTNFYINRSNETRQRVDTLLEDSEMRIIHSGSPQDEVFRFDE